MALLAAWGNCRAPYHGIGCGRGVLVETSFNGECGAAACDRSFAPAEHERRLLGRLSTLCPRGRIDQRALLLPLARCEAILGYPEVCGIGSRRAQGWAGATCGPIAYRALYSPGR